MVKHERDSRGHRNTRVRPTFLKGYDRHGTEFDTRLSDNGWWKFIGKKIVDVNLLFVDRENDEQNIVLFSKTEECNVQILESLQPILRWNFLFGNQYRQTLP